MRQESDWEWLRVMGSISSIGFLILISIGIGLLFGLWLDKMLHTSPIFAFIFTLVGLAAGLYEAVRLLIKAGK